MNEEVKKMRLYLLFLLLPFACIGEFVLRGLLTQLNHIAYDMIFDALILFVFSPFKSQHSAVTSLLVLINFVNMALVITVFISIFKLYAGSANITSHEIIIGALFTVTVLMSFFIWNHRRLKS